VQDVRFALRVLRKSKRFTSAAVETLASAMGANSVVFGVLNALILRPLNGPHPQILYGTEWQSYPNYIDMRSRNHSFEDLAAFKFAFVGLDTSNDAALARLCDYGKLFRRAAGSAIPRPPLHCSRADAS
jgi:hypothetical protein